MEFFLLVLLLDAVCHFDDRVQEFVLLLVLEIIVDFYDGLRVLFFNESLLKDHALGASKAEDVQIWSRDLMSRRF